MTEPKWGEPGRQEWERRRYRDALEDIQRACVTHIDKGEGDPVAFAAWVRRRAEKALAVTEVSHNSHEEGA